MARPPSNTPILRLRFQVRVGDEIGMGPGKAELLELIGSTGSISSAAARMEMSYMRAWSMVRTMNGCFREPLVVTLRGGKGRGGAQLTETGRLALTLYRQLEQQAQQATRTTWSQLSLMLKS